MAEILRSHVPLMRSLGVEADWMVMRGEDSFYRVTKAFHNALQGGDYHLGSRAKETYLATNSLNARHLDGDYDYIIVHDPQPAAIRSLHGRGNAKWVWRCHIDTSAPNPRVWKFLKPYVDDYDALIYTMDQYVSPDLPQEKVHIMPPAVDPLSPKNLPLPKELCKKIVGWVGISTDRPLITQVSRFDPWKDPMGVLEVFRILKQHVPGLQLAMLGHLAMDDPQGWEIYNQVLAASKDDPDIYLFTNFTAASSIEVNAFQTYSDVIIKEVDQRRLRSRRLRGTMEAHSGRGGQGGWYTPAATGRQGRLSYRWYRGVRREGAVPPPASLHRQEDGAAGPGVRAGQPPRSPAPDGRTDHAGFAELTTACSQL